MSQTNSETGLKPWQILSGSGLKIIAVTTMLIDHLAAYYWGQMAFFQTSLLTVGHRSVTLYMLLRLVGRLSFPIFAFLIVEGFLHTRDRMRYGRNLLLFALLSEIPWNLVHSGTWHYPTQNVIFTLLLGYLGLCAIAYYKNDKPRMAGCLLGLLALSVVLRCDYGCSGYGFILLLYALRNDKLLQAVIGSCVLGSRWIAGLAFIPINMYNGKRGFIKGPVGKYFFYIFYPLHLLIIYYLRIFL